MNKFEEMASLLDLYGGLLTDKQKDAMDQYYNYNLSLQEVADNEGITRQGVHDLIQRSEHTLRITDEKLGFRSQLSEIRAGLEHADRQLEELAAGLDACRQEMNRLKSNCMGG
ncbi:DNA-binding protein [Eubacteriales bacterium mix99]